MSHELRTAGTCCYRSNVQSAFDGEVARCNLLGEIVGIDLHEAMVISRDACDACCESFQSSRLDINPIVASLLFDLTEQIVDAGGVSGCDVTAAKKLNQLAERSLPAVAPDEDDAEDIGRRSYEHLANVTVEQLTECLPRPSVTIPNGSDPLAWSVGVTTSPRRLPTLEQCVESVIAAGWNSPTLFVDGDVDIPESISHLDTCRRKPALGAFPNYVLSLAELYMRDPFADAYMMIQDDALMLPSPAVRQYVDQVLWPVEGPAIASLYCSTKYTQPELGWHVFPENWVWGAVAFVFSREALLSIIQSPELWQHRAQPDGDGLSKIDVVIGQIAVAQGIPVYYPSPSLVQHIGTISTIWKVARAVNARRASQFIGDLMDPL